MVSKLKVFSFVTVLLIIFILLHAHIHQVLVALGGSREAIETTRQSSNVQKRIYDAGAIERAAEARLRTRRLLWRQVEEEEEDESKKGSNIEAISIGQSSLTTGTNIDGVGMAYSTSDYRDPCHHPPTHN